MLRIALNVLLLLVFTKSVGQDTIDKRFLPKNDHLEDIQVYLDSTLLQIQKLYYEGDYAKAVTLGNTALNTSSKIDVFPQQFAIRSFIGNTYLRMDDLVAARNTFEDNLKKSQISKNEEYIMGSIIDQGNLYRLENSVDKAIESFLKAGEIAEKRQDTRRIFIYNFNIAEIYVEDDVRYQQAAPYIKKADVASQALDIVFFDANIQSLYGFYYLKLNRPYKAIESFENSILNSEKINNIDGLTSAYQGLIEAYETAGKPQQALETFRSLDSIKQSQFILDKEEYKASVEAKVENLAIQQALSNKELEYELIREKAYVGKVILIFITLLVVVLSSLLLLLRRSSKKRKVLIQDLKCKNGEYLKEKKLSEKLALAKNKFFSTVTHDLRTPLYGIIGLANTLIDEPGLKNYKADIKSLKFSADYLLALINDVLQINKLESNNASILDQQEFSIWELMEDIVESLQYIKRQNGNTLEVSIDSNVPELVLGDRLKFSQILMNLISNALKFTKNGCVNINISQESRTDDFSTLSFEVKDNGKGIPVEKQKIIFEEFGQLDKANVFEGTGLGLAIVTKLLRLMNSMIHLESRIGKGSKFYFSITFKKGRVGGKSGYVGRAKEEVIGLRGKKILIVDDNKINRLVTGKILSKYEMIFDVAENGAEAVNMAGEKKYDLILMDINMPGMDGIEATRRIRSFDEHAIIIGLTAVELVELDDRLQNVYLNDVIIKPFAIHSFLNKLNKHIGYN